MAFKKVINNAKKKLPEKAAFFNGIIFYSNVEVPGTPSII